MRLNPPRRWMEALVVASATQRWRGLSLSAVLLAVWIVGAAFFLLRMIFGLRQVRALRRFGLPWRDGQSVVEPAGAGCRHSPACGSLAARIVVRARDLRLVRPAIVLPPDTQEWEAEDLNRAIVHELEHVRRFDWTSHCLARIACAVYWFHPLVWVAWRQFALEAERSCDDAVLARSEATAYADQLVGLARRLSAAQKSPALAMANRSDLSARVGSVLDGGQGARPRRRVPGGGCLRCRRGDRADYVTAPNGCRAAARPDQAPRGIFRNGMQSPLNAARMHQSRPWKDRGAGAGQSPDRLTWNCVSVSTLINQAYSIFAGGQSKLPPYPVPIERLPSWADSERYTIEAKPQGNPGTGMMRGPMLQALLEDRFALKIRRETREGRVYLMTVAKGGPKLPPFQGGCTPISLAHPLAPRPEFMPCVISGEGRE